MINILVVNDDGFDALGIKILASKLKKYGNVTIVGPSSHRSASSHAIKIREPISFKAESSIDNIKRYSISGYPADTVRLATDLLGIDFDICFSGVNNGLNLGTDIIYSGTVSAAREASIEGICSVALSCDVDCFDIVSNELDSVLEFVFNNKLYSRDYTLNINFPISSYKKSNGFKFAHQGIKRFKTTFIKIENGVYSENGSVIIGDNDIESDVYLASLGYITFVPIIVSQTNFEILNILKEKIE